MEEGEKRCLCCSAPGGPVLRGQSRDKRDTHGMAAAQLLLQEFDGGQSRHPGSLRSFWLPVHGKGQRKNEPQATSSLSSKRDPKPPRVPPRSQAESRAACRAPACHVLSPASPPASPCCRGRRSFPSTLIPRLPKSCPQPWGHLSPAGELCSPVRLRLEHPPGLPQQCAHPQLLQRPGAAEREEKQRQVPLPPSP